jgi:hypothetical protein
MRAWAIIFTKGQANSRKAAELPGFHLGSPLGIENTSNLLTGGRNGPGHILKKETAG